MIKEVYADCAASAPPLKCAYDAMTCSHANPNSGHTLGRESRRDLEDAREIIARCINAKPEEIAFTPSATAACEAGLDFFDSRWPYTNYWWSDYEHKAVFSYLPGDYADVLSKLNKCKAKLVELRNNLYEYETLLHEMSSLSSKNEKEISQLNEHICPECGSVLRETTSLRSKRYNLAEDIVIVKNELQVAIQNATGEIEKEETKYQKLLEQLAAYEEKLKLNTKQANDVIRYKGLCEIREGIVSERHDVLEYHADNEYIDGCYAHMLANNETGEIYYDKVKELSEKYTVFTDATAAVGQIPVDVQDLGVAALAAGAHKFGGYPGIGFLYVRGGIKDDDTFPGTPPVALAVAMAQALEYRTNNIIESMNYLLSQRMALISRIMTIPGAHINCLDKKRLPNILSVRFDGVNARELLSMLDVNGVYASAGAACSADADEPSRTLLASGLTEEEALSTIRLSFCPETTPEAFSFVSDALRRSVSNLRALSR